MIRAGYLALVFFGLLAFFNALQHPFVHDDVVFILKNPHIADLNHWYEAFKPGTLGDGINTYYRPVLEVLYRLEYHLFGPNPFGFHLFNLIVHIINGLLLFKLLQRLVFSHYLAWIISLFFLIHPVQTEAVSCVAGISNLWMALGVLLALNFYLSKRYVLTLLFFILAFLSKEQALVFVPLLILIDCSRGEKNFRSWVFWVLTAVVLLWLRQGLTGASLLKDIMASPGELYLRLAAIPRVIGTDLRLIFFPHDLHYYRSTDILQSNTFAWIMALISIVGGIYAFKRWPQVRGVLILGLGWFFVTLLPVINIVPLINEYSFILTAEHFLYLPIIGILIIIVLFLYSLPLVATNGSTRYEGGRVREGVLVIVLFSCFLLTWHQNTFWKNEIILFKRMLQFEPHFGRGHLLLAKAYYFNGRPQQADAHFKQALTIMAGYAKKSAPGRPKKFYETMQQEILFDWSQNEAAQGQWPRVLEKLKQAAAINGASAAIYNNMAIAYLQLGDKEKAVVSLQEALRLDPSFTQAKQNLRILSS